MHMGSLKASGPDGVPTVFHQNTRMLSPYVTAAVQYFFEHGYLLQEWNATLICLISKIDKPEEASQFRPISLCNVVYKIISKVL